MRKFLKFCHSLGAVGLLGTMATLLVAGILAVKTSNVADLRGVVELMDAAARWLLLPSLALTLVSGLFAMAAVPAYHSAGWVWAKLATGVLTFEGTLMAIQGPVQSIAERVAQADGSMAVGDLDFQAVTGSLWVLIGVAVVNIGLGVWRPKFSRRRKRVAPAS